MNLRSKKINNECGGDTCSESTFITSDKGPDQDHFFSEQGDKQVDESLTVHQNIKKKLDNIEEIKKPSQHFQKLLKGPENVVKCESISKLKQLFKKFKPIGFEETFVVHCKDSPFVFDLKTIILPTSVTIMAKEVIVINTSQIKFSRPEVNDEQPKKKFLLLFNCIDNEEGLSVPHSSKYGDSFVACVQGDYLERRDQQWNVKDGQAKYFQMQRWVRIYSSFLSPNQ